MYGIPNWIMAIIILFPTTIIVVIAFRLMKYVDIMVRAIKNPSLNMDNAVLATFRVLPYLIMFYYIFQFSIHILEPSAWGWTGVEYNAVPVKNSARAMTELLLMEGIPVVLSTMMVSALIRAGYKYVVGGKE